MAAPPNTKGSAAAALKMARLVVEAPYLRARHEPRRDRFQPDAHRERRGTAPRAGHVAEGEPDGRGRGHAGQADRRAVGDRDGTLGADQEPLVQPPISDRSGPGREECQAVRPLRKSCILGDSAS